MKILYAFLFWLLFQDSHELDRTLRGSGLGISRRGLKKETKESSKKKDTEEGKVKICKCKRSKCKTISVAETNILEYAKQGYSIGPCDLEMSATWSRMVADNFIEAFNTFYVEDFSTITESDIPAMEKAAEWLQQCWLSALFGGLVELGTFTWNDYDEFCLEEVDAEGLEGVVLNCPAHCWKYDNDVNSGRRLQPRRKPDPSKTVPWLSAANDNKVLESPREVKTFVTKGTRVFRFVRIVTLPARVLTPIGWATILVELVIIADDPVPVEAIKFPEPGDICNELFASCEFFCGAAREVQRGTIFFQPVAELGEDLLGLCSGCDALAIANNCERFAQTAIPCYLASEILDWKTCPYFPELCVPESVCCIPFERVCESGGCALLLQSCPNEFECPDGRIQTGSCDECGGSERTCSPGSAGEGQGTLCVSPADPSCCPGAKECPNGEFVEPESCCESEDCPSNQECVTESPCIRFCSCPSGYLWDPVEEKCENINECEIQRCFKDNEKCVDTPGDFTCVCEEGFERDLTDSCVDINECLSFFFPCGPGRICINEIGASVNEAGVRLGYRCEPCPTGYEPNAAGLVCKDIDECLDTPCAADETCSNEPAGSFTCTPNCPGGLDCGNLCVALDECCPGEKKCTDGSCVWEIFCCPEERYCDPVRFAQPPVARGDPQLMTFFGFRYECQAEGEFILLKSLDSAFEIQARFTAVGSSVSASVVTGFVIRDETYPTVQLSIARDASSSAISINGCAVQLYIDGNLQSGVSASDLNSSLSIDGGRIVLRADRFGSLSFPEHRLVFNFGIDSTNSFNCFFFGESLNFPISYGGSVTPRPGYRHSETLFGLFGSPYSSQIFFTRDGSPLNLGSTLPIATYQYCTEQFCLHSESDSLFTYESGYSFSDFFNCDAPFAEIDLNSASQEVQDLCGQDVSCLTDGVVGGVEAAMLTIEAQLAEDEQRGASSRLRFHPAVIQAFSPTLVTITVELTAAVTDLEGFAVYRVFSGPP